MANTRPVTCLYSDNPSVRVLATTCLCKGHSTTVYHAILAATERILEGPWMRADVYNQYGLHVYSIVRTGCNIRVTYIGDLGEAL